MPPKGQAATAAAPTLERVDRFHEALEHVLVHEGGKVDHPKDPGGRTNKGITQRVYNAWRTKSHLPVRDVYQIDDKEVEAIYRFQYWEPIKGDALPPGVGYVVFDGAVNSGVRQSGKWLQRALGAAAGKVDGIIGSVTITAAQQDHDHDALISRIAERRMAFLKALKTWPTFGKGWTRRVSSVMATGQAWAMGTIGPKVDYIPGAEQKAVIEDAKQLPSKAPGDAAAGGGIASGGLGGILQTVQDQLTPYSSAGSWIKTLVVLLIVLGGLVAIGGFLYRGWAKRKEAALVDALDIEVNT